MSVIEDVRRDREDLARVIKKHVGIRKIVEELYPDSAHFIYELLQNAEDTGATEAQFSLSRSGLVFEHNGRPFEVRDLQAITDIGEGTKAGDDDKIGRFGVGFKAVFAYSETPHIWSPTFSFKITGLVLPNEIEPVSNLGSSTRFQFPFNNPKKPANVAFDEVTTGLQELAETTLLFLPKIRLICWQIENDAPGMIERLNYSQHHIELRQTTSGGDTISTHYLKFDQPVKGLLKQNVSVAFELQYLPKVDAEFDPTKPLSKQMKIVPAKPGRVAVFFPAEKEVSGLRFHLHAPFVPELSRASIKDTPANKPLFERLAELTAASLHEIRDLGLLSVDFLEVLPNNQDTIEDRYEVIKSAIIDKMNEQPLTPTHAKGHAPASHLIQGKTSLKSLLTNEDLEFLIDYEDRPFEWAAGVPQKNSNADRFMESLDVMEWGLEVFIDKLTDYSDEVGNWLHDKSAQWHQELYALIRSDYLESPPTYSRETKAEKLGSVPIVLLTSGEHITADECFFGSRGSECDENLKQVDEAVYSSGKSKSEQSAARCFLEEIGVRPMDEAALVESILKQRYDDETDDPDDKTYRKDLKRFVALVEKDSEKGSLFENYYIFKSVDNQWHTPQSVYLDSPFHNTGLRAYYSALDESGDKNKQPLAESYLESGFDLNQFVKFARSVGVVETLKVDSVSCEGNLARDLLKQDESWGSGNPSRIDRDFTIWQLDKVLKEGSRSFSQLVWKTLSNQKEDSWIHAQYRAKKQSVIRTAPSQLVCLLRDTAWIPRSDDTFVRPAEATRDDLPAGFAFDSGWKWLAAIEFGKQQVQKSAAHQAKVSAAMSLGVPEELIPEFLELSDEEKKNAIEAALAHARASRQPAFPVQSAKDPDRRAKKVRERLAESPPVKRESRERTVRTSKNSVDPRTYLREFYTNEDKVMVCQACHNEMPFRLSDGKHYFEAVELFDELKHEYRENHLAMCPVCAAKFRHACEFSAEELREVLQTTEELQVELTLAGVPHQIRFVADHRTDLLPVIEAESEQSNSIAEG